MREGRASSILSIHSQAQKNAATLPVVSILFGTGLTGDCSGPSGLKFLCPSWWLDVLNKYADIFQKLYHNMRVFAYHAYPKVTFTHPRQNLKAEGRNTCSGVHVNSSTSSGANTGPSCVLQNSGYFTLWSSSMPILVGSSNG